MVVLFYIDSFPSFSETFIRDQIIKLMDKGIDVRIFANVFRGNQNKALKDFSLYKLIEKTTFWKKLIFASKTARLLNIVLILVRAFFLGNLKYYIKILQSSNIKKSLKERQILFLNYVIKNQITIVHCHYGTNGKDCIYLKKIDYPIKLICTFHGYDLRLGLKKGKYFYDSLFKYADKIVSISSYNKKSLLSLGANLNQLIDIKNGIDCNRMSSGTVNINYEIKFLSVGRLVYDKNYELVINAMYKLKNEYPNLIFKYEIIGDGNLKKKLIDEVRFLNLNDIITFHLAKESKFVFEKLRNCNALLLSSINEALPTVILEAFSLKKPVLATNVGAIKDLVIDQKTGVLVEANLIEFYRGLVRFIEMKNEWSEMGMSGFNLVKQEYNIDLEIAKLINCYNEL